MGREAVAHPADGQRRGRRVGVVRRDHRHRFPGRGIRRGGRVCGRTCRDPDAEPARGAGQDEQLRRSLPGREHLRVVWR